MRAAFLCIIIVAQVALLGCSGSAGATMTFEELRQKILVDHCNAEWREGGPVAGGKGTVDLVKERLGRPFKEQVLGDTIYLYYRVREGTAQIKVVGYNPEFGFRGVTVDDVNLL